MVVLLVILTIIIFLSVNFFVERKQKKTQAGVSPAVAPSLGSVFRMMPKGIFLQPEFTWSRILNDGDIALGIQPALLGLTGKPDEIVITAPGAQMQRGENLLEIRKGERVLGVKSPLNGKITAINETAVNAATCDSLSRHWLFVIQPDNIAGEIPTWMIAEKADAWIREKYRELREFFIRQQLSPSALPTLPDGGEIPVGILNEFDNDVWEEFEKTFCDTGK